MLSHRHTFWFWNLYHVHRLDFTRCIRGIRYKNIYNYKFIQFKWWKLVASDSTLKTGGCKSNCVGRIVLWGHHIYSGRKQFCIGNNFSECYSPGIEQHNINCYIYGHYITDWFWGDQLGTLANNSAHGIRRTRRSLHTDTLGKPPCHRKHLRIKRTHNYKCHHNNCKHTIK